MVSRGQWSGKRLQLSANWLINSKAGKSVYLGAADTFRAAAVEQLMIWGERVGGACR